MTNYDLLSLSPFEFEALVRDLLQLHLGLQLESFGPGKDEGIDLRYIEEGGIIIQCKRYADFGNMLQNLKKETVKLEALKPNRYIIATSLSLSPDRKKRIFNLFQSNMLSISDIFGREDLNNLIVQHPKVERDNFKLWLSSTNVLQTIINSQVINQSRFVLDEIKNKVNVYVQNSSFYEAEKILRENHYIIISGIPGIGKTTLAEILVFDALAKGFEEFVYLADTISNGFQLFDENRPQVFLFDDFLGSNFLQATIGTNEEMQILKFIKKVKDTPNKRLIFTTREYILNQAKQKFERFDQANFVKCILDLSKYTTNIRAKILYNHLYFNHIPYEYVNEIIRQGYLMKIIEHRNYSPRIIENFSRKEFWQDLKAIDFPDMVINTFDLPFSIWEHAFEHQISNLAKVILLNMTICGPQISYDGLYNQVRSFKENSKNSLPFELSAHAFKYAIKELDNSFITTAINWSNTVIKYQNPSIRDFLTSYLNHNDELVVDLIQSATYLSNLLNIFSSKRQFAYVEMKVALTKTSLKAIEERVLKDFDSMIYSVEGFGFNEPGEDDLILLKLYIIKQTFQKNSLPLYNFIKSRLSKLIYSEEISYLAVIAYTELLTFFYVENDGLDITRILLNLGPAIDDEEHITILNDFEQHFPEAYIKFREEQDEIFCSLFENIVKKKISGYNDDIFKLQSNINDLEELGNTYQIDFTEPCDIIRDEIRRINESQDQIYLEYFVQAFPEDESKLVFDARENKKGIEKKEVEETQRILTEKEKIENIFKSLE